MPLKGEAKKEWRRQNRDKQLKYKENYLKKIGKWKPKIQILLEKETRKHKKNINHINKLEQKIKLLYFKKILTLCGEQRCRKCNKLKLRREFYKENQRFNKMAKICKPCEEKRRREYYNSDEYNNNPAKTFRIACVSSRQKERRQGLLGHNLKWQDFEKIKAKFESKCFKCKSQENLTFDHTNPINRGHIHSYNNTVILCRSCNSLKNDNRPQDFYTDFEAQILSNMGIVFEP